MDHVPESRKSLNENYSGHFTREGLICAGMRPLNMPVDTRNSISLYFSSSSAGNHCGEAFGIFGRGDGSSTSLHRAWRKSTRGKLFIYSNHLLLLLAHCKCFTKTCFPPFRQKIIMCSNRIRHANKLGKMRELYRINQRYENNPDVV